MVNFLTPPGLEGLFDLDSKGVDIRPTLLRVLTDQFLRSPVHSPDEVQRYAELAMRLIDEADIPTRSAVAARLAPHACAPRSIILQLARDMTEIAEPILLHSPCLTPADCEAIIEERGPAYARILARRGKPEAKPEPDLTPIAIAEPAPPTVPVTETQSRAGSQREPQFNPRELCEFFFAAGSFERRVILINLEFAQWPASAPPSLEQGDFWRMETGALRHNAAVVAQELERALGISYQLARRIVGDDLGEPIVVAAKAMGLPADALQRMLLFMNPRVGQSVARVYELAELYHEISKQAAQRMVAVMRAAEPTRSALRAVRALHAAESSRRTLANVIGAPARKPPAITLQRAGREG